MYKVVKTGSTGNAVIYHNSIVVDCGVTFDAIKPYLYDLQLILLTHIHKDHINTTTLKRLQFERPTLRIGCCEWMVEHLYGFRNVDVYNPGNTYDYGDFKIIPIKLYHDVLNCGYRIFRKDHKTIHCTDTAHLDGIEAKNYDLYAIEHNYNEDTVFESIQKAKATGQFSYQALSVNSHLSEQQAKDFIYKNKGDKYEVLRLHESNTI